MSIAQNISGSLRRESRFASVLAWSGRRENHARREKRAV